MDDALGIECGGIAGIDDCESDGGGKELCGADTAAGRDAVGIDGGSPGGAEGNMGTGGAGGAPAGMLTWPMLASGFGPDATDGRGGGGGCDEAGRGGAGGALMLASGGG